MRCCRMALPNIFVECCRYRSMYGSPLGVKYDGLCPCFPTPVVLVTNLASYFQRKLNNDVSSKPKPTENQNPPMCDLMECNGPVLILAGKLPAHVSLLLRGAESAGDRHDQHQPVREAQRGKGEFRKHGAHDSITFQQPTLFVALNMP